ncbi:MAG: hypothetical protein ACI9HY_000587, partial [Planctomycetaceae bacterium]
MMSKEALTWLPDFTTTHRQSVYWDFLYNPSFVITEGGFIPRPSSLVLVLLAGSIQTVAAPT